MNKAIQQSRILFLDTQPLVRLLQMHPDYYSSVSEVLDLAYEKNLTILVSSVTLFEISKQAFSAHEGVLARQYRDFFENSANVVCCDVNPEISVKAAELFADAAKSEAGYEAISYGKRIAKSESPATAMKAVFDSFGTVTYNGSRIWDRDARTLYLTLNLPKMVWTEEGHEQEMAAMSSLERGVDIFVHAGVLSGEIEQADAKGREKGNSI